jgi:hypothetical protein
MGSSGALGPKSKPLRVVNKITLQIFYNFVPVNSVNINMDILLNSNSSFWVFFNTFVTGIMLRIGYHKAVSIIAKYTDKYQYPLKSSQFDSSLMGLHLRSFCITQ